MTDEKKGESVSAPPVKGSVEKTFVEELELDNRKMLASIQQYLQRGITEAREKSEVVAKQVNKQAKVFKNLTVVFALFFTYLQVRQIYVGNAGSQQDSKFSAWEMVQNVQGVDTSAGLATALETLIKNCEPLSGLNLKDKYLPEMVFSFPQQDPTVGFLARIGKTFFRVSSQTSCKTATAEGELPTQLDLRGIHFEGANLQEAVFRNADLTGAVFQGAKLQKAEFTGTGKFQPLNVTNFQRANLAKADFGNADLSGANFTGADLRAADFTSAKVEDAVFEGALYSQTENFPNGFDVEGKGLLLIATGAQLIEADLSDMTLSGADIGDVDLSHADLSGSNLDNTVLEGVNIEGANFLQVENLRVEQVKESRNWLLAIFDESFCEQIKGEKEQPQSCQNLVKETR